MKTKYARRVRSKRSRRTMNTRRNRCRTQRHRTQRHRTQRRKTQRRKTQRGGWGGYRPAPTIIEEQHKQKNMLFGGWGPVVV